MSKYLLSVEAIQLEEDAEFFAGAKVKYAAGHGKCEPTSLADPFVLVPYQGGELKLFTGDWLVTYDDGIKEVYNNELFLKTFSSNDQLVSDEATAPVNEPVVEIPATPIVETVLPEATAPVNEPVVSEGTIVGPETIE